MFEFFFGPPSRNKFAAMVLKALRKANPATGYVYNEADFTLDDEEGVINLGNFYQRYCAADRPGRRQLLFNLVATFQVQVDKVSREEALKMAVAAVRERAMFAAAVLQQEIKFGHRAIERAVQEPVTRWHSRTVVLDRPNSMQVVHHNQLEEWGLTFEELFQVGLDRLRGATPPAFAVEDGVFRGTWNDDYDSSRALLPGLLQELPLEGDPVFAMPNRMTLLVTGARSPEKVAAMLAQAEQIATTQPLPMTFAPLTYRAGVLRDYVVEAQNPCFQAVERARHIAAGYYYDQQKPQLEEWHQKLGRDLFVASYALRQDDAGRYISYVVWPRDIPTLLAEADVVLFRETTSTRTITARWDDVKRVAGDLMLDAQLFPMRWYVAGFPTEAQFQAMGAEELPDPEPAG